jgi:HAD superfamily hydrolase (TIGR01509 family)
MNIAAVIFDFDELVAETAGLEFKAWSTIFASFGVTLARDEFRKSVGAPSGHWDVVEYLNELTGEVHDRAEMFGKQWTIYQPACYELKPRPGLVPLLDDLQARQIPFGIASNSRLPWVSKHLEILGLGDRFPVIVTREQVENPKPAPDLLVEACRRLNAAPQRSVAMEASPYGIAAAKAAAMCCVACPSALTKGLDFEKADLVLGEIGLMSFELLAEATSRRPIRP